MHRLQHVCCRVFGVNIDVHGSRNPDVLKSSLMKTDRAIILSQMYGIVWVDSSDFTKISP